MQLNLFSLHAPQTLGSARVDWLSMLASPHSGRSNR